MYLLKHSITIIQSFRGPMYMFAFANIVMKQNFILNWNEIYDLGKENTQDLQNTRTA
jgi:hypothetical protein